MFTSSKIYFIVYILFVYLSITNLTWACEGKEREKALEIAHEAMVLGYQAGLTLNFDGMYEKAMRLSNRAQTETPSCMGFYQQIVQAFEGVYTPNEARCMSGVCCDSGGCYQ